MGDSPDYPGPLRWVKAFGIVVLVLVVLVVVMMATGGARIWTRWP